MDLSAPVAPSSATALLRVDGARLWRSLMDLARIGATPKGGVRRIALTDEDRQCRDQVAAWCRAAGLTLRVDTVGNMFARRAGTDPQAAAVATGSHIDTQPSGGKFDGNFGVLAGLEVMRTLNDHGITTRAPNLTRLVVEGETADEWLRLRVDPRADELFSWTREAVG